MIRVFNFKDFNLAKRWQEFIESLSQFFAIPRDNFPPLITFSVSARGLSHFFFRGIDFHGRLWK